MTLKTLIKKHKRLHLLARKVRHPLYKPIQLVSYDATFGLASQWADVLPREFDVVVGVPRQGAIVGSILASKMGLPFSTPDEFLNGNYWFSRNKLVKKPTVNRILLVEDTVQIGEQLRLDANRIKAANPLFTVKTGSLFATNPRSVDYCFIHSPPVAYEFSMLTNVNFEGNVALDFDGVLIREDGTNSPLHLPTYGFKAVITARPETERSFVESWLNRYGVAYGELLMFPKSIVERSFKAVCQFKAASVERLEVALFWESDVEMARYIADLSGVPVYCPCRHEIFSQKLSSFRRPFF